MKHLYYLFVLFLSLGALSAEAQNWRPFRPNGDVHAFHGASADTILTMRLDSAARQGADSVYYFNRIMRRGANNYQWRKAANNQFGQQLRYNPAERTYYVYWDGGPTTNLILDRTLVLKPFARVGTSWTSYFSDYGVQTTLLSRGVSLIDGISDSVATFRLSGGATVTLSKNFGLVSAPVNMLFGVTSPKMLTLARRPAAAGRSYYNPLALLDLQPGDELGYKQEAYSFTIFPCYTGWLLRQVLSRQVMADSVVYTLREQQRTTFSNVPGCSSGPPILTPVAVVRLAASLRTGQWSSKGSGVVAPINADLLSYAYRPAFNGSTNGILTMPNPVVMGAPTSCGTPLLRQRRLYRSGSEYNTGIDALVWEQAVALGTGVTSQGEYQLTYARRTVGGVPQICGSRTDFGTLLPTRSAAAVVLMQLYPNPAAESATLELAAAPGRSATVRLLDGLGRVVGTQAMAAGQTTTIVNLRGLPAGAYLVEVQATGVAPQYLRLQHQQ